jgi:hypothetical protein
MTATKRLREALISMKKEQQLDDCLAKYPDLDYELGIHQCDGDVFLDIDWYREGKRANSIGEFRCNSILGFTSNKSKTILILFETFLKQEDKRKKELEQHKQVNAK